MHYTKKDSVDDEKLVPCEFIISVLFNYLPLILRIPMWKNIFQISVWHFGPHAVLIHKLKSCFRGNQLNF